MKYIGIDSYGKCLHNKDFPFNDSRHVEGWGNRKIGIMSQYLVSIIILLSNYHILEPILMVTA